MAGYLCHPAPVPEEMMKLESHKKDKEHCIQGFSLILSGWGYFSAQEDSTWLH